MTATEEEEEGVDDYGCRGAGTDRGSHVPDTARRPGSEQVAGGETMLLKEQVDRRRERSVSPA